MISQQKLCKPERGGSIYLLNWWKGRTYKNTLPGKALIQTWWRNKKLYRQEKVKRIQHHKTSFTANAEGNHLGRKHKRMKRSTKDKPKTIKKMVVESYISIITLNGNGLNAPTKRHKLAGLIQKQDPYICCLQKTHVRPRDTYRLKWRDERSYSMEIKRKLE